MRDSVTLLRSPGSPLLPLKGLTEIEEEEEEALILVYTISRTSETRTRASGALGCYALNDDRGDGQHPARVALQ